MADTYLFASDIAVMHTNFLFPIRLPSLEVEWGDEGASFP